MTPGRLQPQANPRSSASEGSPGTTTSKELRDEIARDIIHRDRRNRRIQPLSLSSIRRLFDTLASILDEAIEDGQITHNYARSKRMRLDVPKPRRTFLEMDELAALLDAAAAKDQPLDPQAPLGDIGPRTRLVAHLLAQGKRPNQIAMRLGITKGTLSWHFRRLGANVGRGYVGRRAI